MKHFVKSFFIDFKTQKGLITLGEINVYWFCENYKLKITLIVLPQMVETWQRQ